MPSDTKRPGGPWVIDTRDLGRRAGVSRRYHRTGAAPRGFGNEVIAVPVDSDVQLDVLAEAVLEGVLVTGTVTAIAEGECSRCLDEVEEDVNITLTELFAYPDSTTERTTDADEVSRVVDDLIDLEPIIRDGIVLTVPHAPLCSPDCRGLCPECGEKWVDLAPDHKHEKIDPRWAALTERLGDTGEGR